MNRLLTLVLIVLIGANGWYAWYQWKHALPAQTQLDADIGQIDREISDASVQRTSFQEGSLLQILVDGRLSALQSTRAMLDQKRLSLLRGIDINYIVNGQGWTSESTEVLKGIEAEVAVEDAKIADADFKANSTGGLLAILGQVTAQIEHMNGALLRQRYLAAKYGFPYAAAVDRAATDQKKSIGKVVNAPDAL